MGADIRDGAARGCGRRGVINMPYLHAEETRKRIEFRTARYIQSVGQGTGPIMATISLELLPHPACLSLRAPGPLSLSPTENDFPKDIP